MSKNIARKVYNISVIGAGHVGLVTASCLADLGHKVCCMDNDSAKIDLLQKGEIPIYEPGLKELVSTNTLQGNLFFTNSMEEAVAHGEVIFIAVGTPPKESGEADLSYVENVAREIAQLMDSYKLIVEKSTVPVETGEKVKNTINLYIEKDVPFDVASNPEFLREGSAIHDFMHPDRVVIGVDSERAERVLTEIYGPLNAPIIITDIKSAELIKHASNSFLAMKISFINAVSRICAKVGADVEKVAKGIGLDKRIGQEFLNAGIGFGGSCFPKDLDAFIHIAENLGYDFKLLKEVKRINEEQKRLAVQKIKDVLWIIKDKKIAIWGGAFKPETDDIRGAPVIDIINELLNEGATVSLYDPQAMENLKIIFGEKLHYADDKYQAIEDADCLVIVTEWDEFRNIDFDFLRQRMKLPFIVDGRNIFSLQKLQDKGFIYCGFGRPQITNSKSGVKK
ncbi:MAG: UDP-glucose 6-dehydrogenase [Candidatus Omnitrophota bacterium]|nr:MAG: UDP-glucose 6-dehydrogenase [Candidatus Omnitrophota bacterium]